MRKCIVNREKAEGIKEWVPFLKKEMQMSENTDIFKYDCSFRTGEKNELL